MLSIRLLLLNLFLILSVWKEKQIKISKYWTKSLWHMHESVHRYRHNHTQLRCTARIVQIMNSRCMCLHCPAGNKLFYVHPHQRLVNHDPFWVKIRKKIKCTQWWFDRISKIRKTNEEYPVMHDHTSLLFVLSKMEIRYFASRGRLIARMAS